MSTQRPRQSRSFVKKRQGDTLLNAIIGAVASVVLSFTGVSVILGGVVAGYLQNQGKGTGAKVGGLSGAIAAIPAFFLIWLFFGTIGMFGFGAGEVGIGAVFGGVMVFLLVVVLVLSVGMGALGGFIGGALADDRRGPAAGRGRGQGRSREASAEGDWNDSRDDRRGSGDRNDDRSQY